MESKFTIQEQTFFLQLHSCLIDYEKLKNKIQENPTTLKIDATIIEDHVRVVGKSECNIHNNIIEFFSHLNDVISFSNFDYLSFNNHITPLVSCVILLTFNDEFILRQLIPSIIHNSNDHPIEIIIIYNGSGCNLDKFTNFKLIESDPFQVAKAYNKGIKAANGKYIALFHDDCVLNDSQWIEKSINNISGNCLAVTSEFDKHTAKFVPFVIKKSTILELGELDEYYFFGIEDMDLTFNIYNQQNDITQAINSIHYRGMSTILLYIEESSLLKMLFSHNILSPETIRSIQQMCLKNALENGLEELTTHYSAYFFNKYKDILKHKEPALYAEYNKLNNTLINMGIDKFKNENEATLKAITGNIQKTTLHQITTEINSPR